MKNENVKKEIIELVCGMYAGAPAYDPENTVCFYVADMVCAFWDENCAAGHDLYIDGQFSKLGEVCAAIDNHKNDLDPHDVMLCASEIYSFASFFFKHGLGDDVLVLLSHDLQVYAYEKKGVR